MEIWFGGDGQTHNEVILGIRVRFLPFEIRIPENVTNQTTVSLFPTNVPFDILSKRFREFKEKLLYSSFGRTHFI